MLSRIFLALVLALAPLPAALALENTTPTVSQGLVSFSSDEGLVRLSRSDARVNFPALANQFEAEYVGAFCGPASAAMVLNAVRGRSEDLPRDASRYRSEDLQYPPKGVDPTTPRFTQDNVIAKGPKTRAQIFGEPVTINGKQVHDFGFQLRQLDDMLKVNGLATRLVVVDDGKDEQEIRGDLIDNLKQAAGQPGPPHISPLAAYDAESDSFLVLDVNPARADWVWMPTSTLIKAMRTFDTIENRGYILVEPR